MFRHFFMFPVALGSSALTALKGNTLTKPKSRFFYTLPLSVATLLSTRHPIKMLTKQVEQKIRKEPKGIEKYLSYGVRFLELALIFLPSILLLPLAIFRSTLVIWMKVFVWSISKAGVVWIKVFQHMSHRGDVIGEDLADSF